jgi:hypothetical protein
LFRQVIFSGIRGSLALLFIKRETSGPNFMNGRNHLSETNNFSIDILVPPWGILAEPVCLYFFVENWLSRSLPVER